MFEKYKFFCCVTSASSKTSGIDKGIKSLEMGKDQVKVTLHDRGKKKKKHSSKINFKGQIYLGELFLVGGQISNSPSLKNGGAVKELS